MSILARSVRAILAEILDDRGIDTVPDETPLFVGGLGLSSLDGAALLHAIDIELGVPVADLDLALTCLETVGTLCAFVDAHRVLPHA